MKTNPLPVKKVQAIIENALEEDAGRGDITSEILISCELEGRAFMLIKEAGVLAGAEIVEKTFHTVDPSLKIEVMIPDGSRVKSGDVAMQISGKVRSILKAERVALNFFQRLSGIASTTAEYVDKLRGTGVEVADTRKTTPGLRILEKYAVKMGGGRNHRMDLGDAILVKDNHFIALKTLGMSYRDIVTRAKQNAPPEIKVEVEATTVKEAAEAAEAGVDIIMLDNMNPGDMAKAVELIGGRAEVEASGNFRLNNIREAAATGVDFVSVGALTHSYKSLDISLELESQTFKLV
jgi:nicotinate-nucleotide pyrophosphorylase (carboxylating)